MKRQVKCVINAAAIVVLSLVTSLTIYTAFGESKIGNLDSIFTSQSEVAVKDYIIDNYEISERNPWSDYGLSPVEYQEYSENAFDKKINAKAAIVVNADTGEIYYEKNADKKMYPASTTKLMTALTVLQILDLDHVVTVGDEVSLIGAGSSVAGFSKGQQVTVKELLQGLLISSGNDAAYILAKAAGQYILEDNIENEGKTFTSEECVERFVYEMNKNVRDMELENTRFESPDGYDDEGQYTTAGDLSKIAVNAYANKTIRKICGTESQKSETLGKTWESTNLMLHKDSEYYYKFCKGLKTGSTDNAGKCLVSASKKNGNTFICVVMKADTEENRVEDSLKLLKAAAQVTKE